MTELALLGLVLVLVAINGFFVAAEFAVVRSRRSRLEQMANAGDVRAAAAVEQLDHVDDYVATSQVGITLASVGIGFLGEPALAELLEPLVDGALGHSLALAVSLALAYTIITLLHVILGEQAPKMVGIARAEFLLLLLAGPMRFFRRIFTPLIALTNPPARFLVKRVLRVDPTIDDDLASAEELRVMIDQGARGGRLDRNEATMLGGVFHLHEQEAREIMTPIPAVVTIDAGAGAEEALRRCVSSGHTRLVVIEDGNPDRVRGIVHNNSLARLFLSSGSEASIGPAIRPAPIVPETKAIDDLLAELRHQRASMAIVSDEYGRTIGIVTVEDILEEVVGEIEDETDDLAAVIRPLPGGDLYVRGHVALGDLVDAGVRLPVATDAYNSVGGYVFSELGRLPHRGDRIRADRYEIRVESVRENRIVAVRIHPLEAGEPALVPPGQLALERLGA